MTTHHHLVYDAATAPPTAAVVWLHGFGDAAEGWADEFRELRVAVPHVKWIHIRAPLRPQTCFNGFEVSSWGNYLDQGCTRIGSLDYDNEAIASYDALKDVHTVLDDLVTCMPLSRVVVGGFSMGATVAAEAALKYIHARTSPSATTLGALVLLNGYLLPGARSLASDGAASGLRVLVAHGTADEQVEYDCGAEAARALRESCAEVTFSSFQGLDHAQSGFGPGKVAASDFIKAVVSSDVGSTRCGNRKRRNNGECLAAP